MWLRQQCHPDTLFWRSSPCPLVPRPSISIMDANTGKRLETCYERHLFIALLVWFQLGYKTRVVR